MLTKDEIRQIALNAGADACGFGCMSRFDGAPDDVNPRYLFPRAKTVIGFVFRIPRGVQRGIEEGTHFFQYPSLAYGGINEVYAPVVMYEVARALEDDGYEALVFRNTGGRGVVSDFTGEYGNTISPEIEVDFNRAENATEHHRTVDYTRPVSNDKRCPDLQFHFRLAAVACGLGEIGLSKMLLVPKFGPMLRVAFIFTDAEYEPDPLYNGPALCRKCGACIRECPGKCLNKDKMIRITMEDKVIEWADIDVWKCYNYYAYPGRKYDPFTPTETYEKHKDDTLFLYDKDPAFQTLGEKEILNVYKLLEPYDPSWIGYNMAKCGGCIAACVNALEKHGGCMEGVFKEPLRTGKAHWKINR